MTQAIRRLEGDAPSVAGAAQAVLDAAERVALDSLEIVLVESRLRLRGLARKATLIALGALLLLIGLAGAEIALVVALARWLALDASLGVVAGAQAALGLLVLALCRRGGAAQ